MEHCAVNRRAGLNPSHYLETESGAYGFFALPFAGGRTGAGGAAAL